jgi:acetyl-CoA carboxylase biotin carboxyl carrier protein
MDIKEIQNLIKFVQKSGVEEVKIERENFKLTIKTKTDPPQQIIVEDNILARVPSTKAISPSVINETPEQKSDIPSSKLEVEDEQHIVIKSPIIGTFYRKPSPDKPSFVEVGKSIAKGDVLCVIEAMKLFNEIESEFSGKILKILVDDQSPVEFDQPLFIIDPS